MKLIRTICVIGLCAVFARNSPSAAATEDCGTLPGNMSAMSFEELTEVKDRIDVEMNKVMDEMDRVRKDLEKVDRFSKYQQLGYSKRNGICAKQYREFSPAHEKYEAIIKSRRKPDKKFKEHYLRVRTNYTICMNKAISEDTDFKNLLDEDPGVAKVSPSERYTVGTASGRYEELKADLIPKGEKRFMDTVIKPRKEELSKTYEDRRTCLTKLDDANSLVKGELLKKATSPLQPDL